MLIVMLVSVPSADFDATTLPVYNPVRLHSTGPSFLVASLVWGDWGWCGKIDAVAGFRLSPRLVMSARKSVCGPLWVSSGAITGEGARISRPKTKDLIEM